MKYLKTLLFVPTAVIASVTAYIGLLIILNSSLSIKFSDSSHDFIEINFKTNLMMSNLMMSNLMVSNCDESKLLLIPDIHKLLFLNIIDTSNFETIQEQEKWSNLPTENINSTV